MRYKITKQADLYYIRNTKTNTILKTAYYSYEEAKQVLSVSPDVCALEYLLDQEMHEKLKPLLKDNSYEKILIDKKYYSE